MAREGSLVVNWHPIILLLLSLAVVVGCVDDDDNDYKLEVTETRTWPASGISEIAATTENGNISVSATQDTVITALITRRCYGRDRADAENYIDNVVVEDSVAGGQLAQTNEMTVGKWFPISTLVAPCGAAHWNPCRLIPGSIWSCETGRR